MKGIFILLISAFLSYPSFASRNILQNEGEKIGLDSLLLEEVNLSHFPRYNDRHFWDKIPEIIVFQYIQDAEKVLNFTWPTFKATDYLEIIRSGDRLQERFELPHKALNALIIGEMVEGKGRFMDQIVNGVWYYCEQTWWGWSAHIKDQKSPDGLPDVDEPIIDLGVGEVSNTLSMAYLLLRNEMDKIHPLISLRLKREVMMKAIIPYYNRNDFWWMGFKPWFDEGSVSPRRLNNWNAWINYNMLLSIMILEDDPAKRVAGVNKVLRSTDNLINTYPDDGGCDEGPGYWKKAGGCVYLTLDLLRKTTNNSFNVFENPLIRNMGTYIYKASINYPYFLNFADADATGSSYPDVIYLFGKEIKDLTTQKFGAYVASRENWGQTPPSGNLDRMILQLSHLDEIATAEASPPLVSDFWLPDTQLAGARDRAGTTDGFYFASKGGYNDESHNHNDAGTFILYYNGKPCIIDIGRATYTAKTFGPNRYDIWNLQSQYHNLPSINTYNQSFGTTFRTNNTRFTATTTKAVFTTDIAGAYPDSAMIDLWRRTYTLNRGKSFSIEDNYTFSEIKNGPSTLNFITCCKVEFFKEGVLRLTGDDYILYLNYEKDMLVPAVEFIEITDAKLANFWPEGITRIVFTFKNQTITGRNLIEITKT